MISDEAALLRAICEHPDEDVPRLMYADEIEDRDPERAAFIRSQCAASCELIEAADGRKGTLPVLFNQIAAVVDGYYPKKRDQWAGEPLCRIPSANYLYSRGFVRNVTMTCKDFLEHAEELFRQHPILSVTLSDRKPDNPGNAFCFFPLHHPYQWERDDLQSHIPIPIYEHFDGGEQNGIGGYYWRIWWGTQSDKAVYGRCLNDLSRACVNYARKKVGLSRIPIPYP